MVNHFSIGLGCATKSGFYTTTGDDQLSEWTEKKFQSTSQSQTCTKKKRSWSLFGDLNNYSFLNPRETITFEKYAQQIDEMHQKLHCLQLALVNGENPFFLHDNVQPHVAQPMLQKLKELGCEALPRSPDLLPMDYHFFKHLDSFLQGKCFHDQQEAENSFQEFIKSQSTDFYATGINKPISHWQKCVCCNGSYFD